MGEDLYLKQLELGPMQNFVYLIGDKSARECAIVDPGWDTDKILKVAENDGMKITKILITHGHPDHIMGVESLLKKNECKIYVNKKEAEFWNIPWPNLVKLESGDIVEVGKIPVRAIHTPGHTPGSQCFHVANALISGDTLFINSCGRVDLPGGNPEELYESLQKLRALSDKTVVYPGHNYAKTPTSTLADEKQHNQFMQYANVRDFVKAMG